MATRLSETIYFVRDLDEAIQFYTHQVGFKLDERYDWGFAVLSSGNAKLGLMLESLWEREYPDEDELPKARIALQTNDFDGELRRLRSMSVPLGTVHGEHGKRQAVTFSDPDENAIYLWSDPEEPME